MNVSVWDLSDGFDFHNFTLTVKNINDGPIWLNLLTTLQIMHGKEFLYDLNATDYDNDVLKYSISSDPVCDISIDEESGLIRWTADIHLFETKPWNLIVQVSVFDGLAYNNKSFTLSVIPTSPPTVKLMEPKSGARTPSLQTILNWEGTDPEDEPITFDIYLHETEAFVDGLREEALYERDYSGENFTVTGLEPGKTYYWKVIPNDGISFGDCISGIYSFKVNNKPSLKSIENQMIEANTEFDLKIKCTDQDPEDASNLRFYLKEAPDGMTLNEDDGILHWTPSKNQILLHIVTVQVSDGIENDTISFKIQVIKGEETSSSSWVMILVIICIIVIIILLIVFILLRRKKNRELAQKKEVEERTALDIEKEKENLTYEQLYGVPAPEKGEEGMTTRELRDYIHDRIEDIAKEE